MSFQGLSFVREEKKAQAELKEDVKEQKMEVALKEKREVAPKKGPRNSVKTLDKLVDRLASFKIEPEDNRYKSPRDQYSFSARMRRGKHLSGGKSGDGR
jgi:hypothetical protein